MVGAFFEGFLLARICSKSKVEDMIAYLCRNATDKRGLLLWVGIACIDRWARRDCYCLCQLVAW